MSEKEKINQEVAVNLKLKERAFSLFTILITTRVLFLFVVAPISYGFWNRKDTFNVNGSIIDKALQTLDTFDSVQFQQVINDGYQYETNHAFMPLFAYAVSGVSKYTGLDTKYAGQLYQITIAYLTSLILYMLGTKALKNESLAFKAAVIFVFNHSLVYQLSLQSELTYCFMSFLGLLVMCWRVDPTDVVKTVNSRFIIPANIIFGINVLCRAQGVLMLVFTGMIFVKKIIAQSDRFFKIFKYVFYCFCLVIIYFLPFTMVVLWKPYVMHCETKLDRTDAVPKWCFDTIPNVFNYVQKVYWDNRLFGFMYRGVDHILVALPMNIFFVYIVYRFFKHQSGNFMTFGIFSLEDKSIKNLPTIFDNPLLIPFMWNFTINMLLVILYANIDINSRVASTNVIYYWAFAQLIEEYQSGEQSSGGKLVTVMIVIHNLAYMVLNLQLFLTETAFF